MNIFKINRLESRDSFSTYTPFRTILIQVHEARNKLQKFSSSISEKKSYSPFIVDKITIHRDKIKYYSTKKETRNVQNYTAWTNKFKSRTKSLRSNDEKKIRIRLTPHLTWSILSRGPFTREKKTVIRGTWARRVDFDAISSSRKPRERERERVERKEKECQRARRVRQKGTDWNIFFILLPRGGAYAVNLSFSRRLFQPSLIPGWNFVDRLRRWKVKGLGRNEGIEGDGTFFLGAGCCLHKNNRIVLRDKIKKARNEIFSREHVLSMLKASIFVLILVFPSKIRIEQFYSTFFFFFTCFPAFR